MSQVSNYLRRMALTTVFVAAWASCASAQKNVSVNSPDWSAISASVTEAALKKHIMALASCGSRVPGYLGHDQARAYVVSEFRRLGYTDIKEETFSVTVPVDQDTSLEMVESGERFELHALWPNLVRAPQLPPEGVTGLSIFGKSGTWKDLSGHIIKDSIVFMDFNSDVNWLNAAMLGARAIVFVEPQRTVRRQAEAKIAQVPLNMPRFWISRADFDRLSRSGEGRQVRVKCGMRWQQVKAQNLIVRIEGTDPVLRKRLMCIETYYDSMSVVPSLAPGAEAACSMAAMLELARLLKSHPPKSSVLFLAVSGHHIRNAGMTAFVQRHCRKRPPFCEMVKEPIHPDLLVCLDITSKNQTLGLTFQDGSHGLNSSHIPVNSYTREFLRHTEFFIGCAGKLGPVLECEGKNLFSNLILPERGGSWQSLLPQVISFDSVVALVAGEPAVTLATVYDARLALDTPLDRVEGVALCNLARQTRFLSCALMMGLDDAGLLEKPKMGDDCLRLFRGRLVTFDPNKSFMPDEPVSGGIGLLGSGARQLPNVPGSNVGVRMTPLALSNEKGWFEIFTTCSNEVFVDGWGFDPDTGEIVKAVDLGIEGAGQFAVEFKLDTWVKTRKAIVLFECDTTDLYDLVDPRYLIALDKLSFFNPGNAEPFAYGYCLAAPSGRVSTASPYASVFVKPGTRVKFGASSDILGQRMLFLNAQSPDTKKDSEGLGYDVSNLRLVQNPAYQVLRDMYYLDEARIRVLKRYGIDNRRLDRLHAAARENLQQAKSAMEERRWDRFAKHARRGLGIESRAYPDVRGTANDVIKGLVFYMALLLPFAFFCERIFFAFPDLKRRIIAFVAFFIVTYIALRLVHPAFRIVETSEVILLGLVILVLCGTVTAITAGRFETQMRTMKQQLGRVHHADVSRASATATAFALGVSNMRRRKVRTFLTCTAIVLLMFTVLSFTSVKTSLRPRKLSRPNVPAYQGALIRDRTWVPMKFLALEHLSSEFEGAGLLARRSWLGPRTLDNPRLALLVHSAKDEKIGSEKIFCYGLVGFDAAEADVSGLHTTLKSGRWFRQGDKDVCILPDFMAAALNVQADDNGTAQVHIQGMTLTVIGIVDSEQYNNFKDLDNERMTPIDFTTLSREALQRASKAAKDVSAVEGRATLETFIHLDARNTMFLPYETVLDLGGTLQSVAVKFSAGSVSEHIERLLDRLAVTVFVGEGERTLVYSSLAASSVGGMGNILVPVLIAALMILNTMSGSVHERFQEIGTYSSVGLAPSHIGALFLAEACVYAILGGIAGYVLGQILTKSLMAMGVLSGLTLNYSSLASVMATVVVMITVVASTLYPARMASRMAVPDVTRKWVIPNPKGDEWFFDFPFTVSGKEVAGLYVFFRYYFASFEEQSVGRFYTAGTKLSRFAEAGQDGYQLNMRVWLAPYDLGVSQDVELRAVPTGDFGIYSIHLLIKRLSGQSNMWVRTNRGFLDQMRKQFLLWRTISAEGKDEYMADAQQTFTDTEA